MTWVPVWSSAPEAWGGRIDPAVAIDERGGAIAPHQQRRVEIDETAVRGEQQGRRHRERGAHHAADHRIEPGSLRGAQQEHRFGEAAGLVELDIDDVVSPHQPRDIGSDMAHSEEHTYELTPIM